MVLHSPTLLTTLDERFYHGPIFQIKLSLQQADSTARVLTIHYTTTHLPTHTHSCVHTDTHRHEQTHRDKLGLTHTFVHRNTFARTYTHSAQILPSPAMYPLPQCPQAPGHIASREPVHVLESFPCNLPRFRAGYLAAVDNSTGSWQEKVGFDREQVQMVAVGPRCCMETNKSAEIGSSATARPCCVALPKAGALLIVQPVWPEP